MKKLCIILMILCLLTGCSARSKDEPVSSSEPPLSSAPAQSEQAESDESVLAETPLPEPTEAPAITKEDETVNIEITVGTQTFTAELYDNETARAFAALLPLELDMTELNGNEKYFYLDSALPTDASRPDGIRAGDLMLYGSECVVLFYESFSTSYSYTPIGRVQDPEDLAGTLGSGNVTISFTLS